MTVLLLSSVYVISLNYKKWKFLSWSTGIPIFYLMMFFLIPLVNQLTGNKDFKMIQSVNSAVLIAAFGLITFLMGSLLYNLIFYKLLPLRNIKDITEYWPLNVLNGYATVWITLFAGSIAHYYSFRYGYYGLNFVEIPEWPFAGVVVTLSILAETASIVAWCRYFDGNEQINSRWKCLALTSTIILIFFSLGANSKWFLVKPFVIIVLAQYVSNRKINYYWITISLIVYLVFAYPLISLFRTTLYPGIESKAIIIMFFKVFSFQDIWSVYTENWAKFLTGIDRGLLQTFAAIVSKTGHDVDYVLGETYRHGFEALVPRFLWPEKPSLNIGNYIGHYYELIGSTDDITNISPSQMGELYMNFGTFGVLIGMFGWGLIAAFIDDKIIGNGSSWIAVACMLGILWQEGIFSQTVLPFLKTLMAIIAFFIFLKIFYTVCLLNK